MNRTASTMIIILLLLVSFMVGVPFFKTASANPAPKDWHPPELMILSPSQNGNYRSNVPLTLNITLTPKLTGWETLTNLSYILDGKSAVAVAFAGPDQSGEVFVSDVLYGLSDGEHTLFVKGSTDWGNTFSSNVTFTVNPSTQAPDNNPPRISIIFPENKSYLSNGQICLNFSVNKPFLWARYSLDNQANITVLGNQTMFPFLPPGSHSITMYAVDSEGNTAASDTIEFYTVFRSEGYLPLPINPVVSVISPQNATYGENTIPLTFTLNKLIPLDSLMPRFPNVSWVGYSLDGQNNITITGNTTLTGLPNGAHNVTVYAKDIYGNIGASQTIFFTVNADPFPASGIIAGASVAVVISAGLVVYFKKFKQSHSL